MTSRHNRGWLWYFLVLLLLAAVAASSLIVYNLGQQLSPEQLDSARRRWQAHGPRDYRLAYTIKRDDQPVDHYAVRVHAGKVVLATVNGKPVPAAERERVDMEGLFRLMDEHLRLREQAGQPKTFLRAHFDAVDGHVRSYVRAPRGQARLEITVEPPQPLPPNAARGVDDDS
jgi:hypothetical protein